MNHQKVASFLEILSFSRHRYNLQNHRYSGQFHVKLFFIVLYVFFTIPSAYTQTFREVFQNGLESAQLVKEIVGELDNTEVILNKPYEIQADSKGDIYVLDYGENHIIKFDDQLIIGRNEDYTLEIYSPDFELIRKLQHPSDKSRVTKHDRQKMLESLKLTAENLQLSEEMAEIMQKNRKFPEFKPYFSTMIVDRDGAILVQTYQSEGEKSIYDVFESDGEFIEKVALFPFDKRRIHISNGFIYQVIVSSEELPVIKMYQMH